MKFLVAIALLTLAVVARAHHNDQHTLRGPRFQPGKVYKYDVEFNVTSGVLGLSSQVSKSAIKAEATIYAKTEKEHILKIERVFTSGSVKAVEGKDGWIEMEKNSELEDRLSVPIKFNLENGEVTSYTLSPRESLESKKIKKSILRSLEMEVPQKVHDQLQSNSADPLKIPVTYNTTKNTETGPHTTHYLITVSPYPEFPADMDVYNITRSDDYESERYPAYKMHHNFHKQGCPEVCRKDWRSNEYGAGCPMGHEPHHSPIKMSFNHEHHLSLKDNVMNPEIIKTTEVHVAQMYDQDMEVLIKFQMRRKKVNTGSIVEPSGQQTYTDLKDYTKEINEKEIEQICQYKNTEETIVSIKKLLNEIARIIVKGQLEDKDNIIIGQKIILLKNAFKRLNVADLEKVKEEIAEPTHLPNKNEEEKVKRQVWLDILPLIGTEESVTFITQYIKEGLKSGGLMIWEAKEVLEAVPQNIHRPTERNVRELKSLITAQEIRDKVKNNHLLHSATHLTVARVLSRMCGNNAVPRSQEQQAPAQTWFGYQRATYQDDSEQANEMKPVRCPEQLVRELVQEVTRKLKASDKKEDIAVYLETLSQVAVPEVLPVIAEYVYGVAHNVQRYSPSYIDFVKTISLYALHNAATKLPEEVLEIVLPVYFNGTENPKVRNAAFGVLIRCQPSLEVLQHIATRTWREESNEVGSYVTSTLETFGNSSQPCMQLTSHRIKKVMPQLKRFDIGVNHAKNLLWDYFDEQRAFGLESRLEYIPSNESVIPSAIYKSLAYSTDSLRDVLMQMALNVQGLTQEKIVKTFEKILDLRPLSSFDARREKQIFEDANIVARIPDALRLSLYKRIFYSSSYNYLDIDSIKSSVETVAEYLRAYLYISNSEMNGHLVKVFLPSNYHTVTIAKTLPYPVEFEMKQPLVLALKVKSMEKSPTLRWFKLHIRPSVYFTKMYTNQLKNLGDCKEVGVYREHKLAVSYPFEIKYEGFNFPNVTLKYKKPELNKKVLTYFSEAGTYAGKKELETLPSAFREPIRTLPTPFKVEKEVNVVGVPPMNVQVHTEDIAWNIEQYPRNPVEALDIVIRRVMNAGWRYEAMNVTVHEDSKTWPRETEVTFDLKYHREHIARFLNQPRAQSSSRDNEWMDQQDQDQYQDEAQNQYDSMSQDKYQSQWDRDSQDEDQSQDEQEEQRRREDSEQQQQFSSRNVEREEDWSDDMKPFDIDSNKNPDTYINQGRKTYKKLYSVPHIRHMWRIEVQTKPVHTSAHFEVEYNHTYSHTVHAIRAEAYVRPRREQKSYQVNFDHIMAFIGRPNEFHYETHAEKQQAVFISAISVPQGTPSQPWEKVHAVFKGKLEYESLEKLLKNELLTRVNPTYYLPETHEQCLKDIEEGKAVSTDCLKATKERSIYNKMHMTMLWQERVPEVLKTVARRADIYLKHYLFHHLNITEQHNTEKKITLHLNHIDKFVDEPVIDVVIEKPEETIEFKRVPTMGMQPLNAVFHNWETKAMDLTNNTYPPTCALMEKYVRTYDQKTFRFSTEQCNYVLSTHCAKNKYFAVTAQGIDNRKGTKVIRIYVHDDTVELYPKSGNEYKIKYNGKEVEIRNAVVLDSEHELYVYPEYTYAGVNLRVVARRAGIRVTYDGVNVKVQVHPRYKGELCGLCSEYDGEELREYRGVDQCLYSHPIDFANSAITKKEGHCEKSRLLGQKMCYGEENENHIRRPESDDEEETQDDEPIRRNIVQTRGNEFCFSILPVPICEDGSRPTETESEQVAFHCLPKRDVTAKRLLTESKRRVLGEIAHKSPDFEETVDVAKRC